MKSASYVQKVAAVLFFFALSQGVSTPVTAAGFDHPDDDRDGVADVVEKGAPNNGDGNRDGVADYLQARVVSFRSATDKSFVTLSRSKAKSKPRSSAKSLISSPNIMGEHRVLNVQQNPNGTLSLDYEVTLWNVGSASQPDNADPELVTLLPAGSLVDESSIVATSGEVSVVTTANGVALLWDGELNAAAKSGGGSVVVTTTVVVNQPEEVIDKITAQVRLQSTIYMDTDGSGDNETSSLTDDPTLPGEVDPTPVG